MTWEVEHLGPHTLYRGDCREVLPTLATVDAVITDPPYGVLVRGDYHTRIRDDRGGRHGLVRDDYDSYVDTQANLETQIIPALTRALKLARRGAIFSGPHIQAFPEATTIGGIYCPAACGRHEWGFNTFLPILLYGKAPALHLGGKPTTLFSTATAEHNGHPCPKPLPWMCWLVGLTSLSGHQVLDPFMGSGTTGVACVQLGRVFTGIEISQECFDIACQRMHAAMAQPDLFIAPSPRPIQQPLFTGGR